MDGWPSPNGVPSKPRDSLSISAPNARNAAIADGGGSLSGSQRSWVSNVVGSVSFDAAEVGCGISLLAPFSRFPSKRRQVCCRLAPAIQDDSWLMGFLLALVGLESIFGD